jgi:hypothetical protein
MSYQLRGGHDVFDQNDGHEPFKGLVLLRIGRRAHQSGAVNNRLFMCGRLKLLEHDFVSQLMPNVQSFPLRPTGTRC